jgi:hypothetical protein
MPRSPRRPATEDAPRVTGHRLGNPGEIAAQAKDSDWQRITVPGRGDAKALVLTGLWYSVFGPQAVQVVIVRELADTDGYRIALISTDINADALTIVARYADRWPIEVAFQDAKHTFGVGDARNRVKQAVERTVPFSASSVRRSPSPGTPSTATPSAMSVGDASTRPGTRPSATPRCSTSSPRYAAN